MNEWYIEKVENGFILNCKKKSSGMRGEIFVFNTANKLAEWLAKNLEKMDV